MSIRMWVHEITTSGYCRLIILAIKLLQHISLLLYPLGEDWIWDKRKIGIDMHKLVKQMLGELPRWEYKSLGQRRKANADIVTYILERNQSTPQS